MLSGVLWYGIWYQIAYWHAHGPGSEIETWTKNHHQIYRDCPVCPHHNSCKDYMEVALHDSKMPHKQAQMHNYVRVYALHISDLHIKTTGLL